MTSIQDAAQVSSLFNIVKEAAGYPHLRKIHDAAMNDLNMLNEALVPGGLNPADPQPDAVRVVNPPASPMESSR